MKNKTLNLPIFGLIISLLAIIVPAYIQYDIFKKAEPEKKLLLNKGFSRNPLKDLESFSESAILTINNQKISNLYITEITIENIGKTPITPSDFVEPISVYVPKPWKILNITDSQLLNLYKHFSWSRINDNNFIAKPTLLNVGDRFSFNIYLTNEKKDHNFDYAESNKFLNINARIVGLKDFTAPTELIDKYNKDNYLLWGLPISMCHIGLSFTFILIFSPILLAIYLYLLRETYVVTDLSFKSILIIISFGLISFSGIESLATIIFGSNQFWIGSYISYGHAFDWMNTPPIIINIISLTYLLYMHRKPRNTKTID